ncbi:hypothetical protein WJX81_001644 [Elliptochloris bilobata]|uniref:Uncharacterized protein n=1 Tax=Elliptochloris bilobata TaxID=381761 RepID=A0AAW1RMM9_9CHLO
MGVSAGLRALAKVFRETLSMGLTERQALALALAESRRAALAVQPPPQDSDRHEDASDSGACRAKPAPAPRNPKSHRAGGDGSDDESAAGPKPGEKVRRRASNAGRSAGAAKRRRTGGEAGSRELQAFVAGAGARKAAAPAASALAEVGKASKADSDGSDGGGERGALGIAVGTGLGPGIGSDSDCEERSARSSRDVVRPAGGRIGSASGSGGEGEGDSSEGGRSGGGGRRVSESAEGGAGVAGCPGEDALGLDATSVRAQRLAVVEPPSPVLGAPAAAEDGPAPHSSAAPPRKPLRKRAAGAGAGAGARDRMSKRARVRARRPERTDEDPDYEGKDDVATVLVLRAPLERVTSHAWSTGGFGTLPSGRATGSLGSDPAMRLEQARSQRLLESTWDDLLARQAAEAQTAEAFAAWLSPAPAQPRSQFAGRVIGDEVA